MCLAKHIYGDRWISIQDNSSWQEWSDKSLLFEANEISLLEWATKPTNLKIVENL